MIVSRVDGADCGDAMAIVRWNKNNPLCSAAFFFAGLRQ